MGATGHQLSWPARDKDEQSGRQHLALPRALWSCRQEGRGCWAGSSALFLELSLHTQLRTHCLQAWSSRAWLCYPPWGWALPAACPPRARLQRLVTFPLLVLSGVISLTGSRGGRLRVPGGAQLSSWTHEQEAIEGSATAHKEPSPVGVIRV